MHYKNGRVAHNGDFVVVHSPYPGNKPYFGILYDAKPDNDFCNGRVAELRSSDFYPNLKEALHLDDFLAGQPATYRDTSLDKATTDVLPTTTGTAVNPSHNPKN